MSSEVTLDFGRTVLLGRPHRECVAFASRLAAHGQLAGCVWETPSRRASLRLWRRRVARHGLAATTSRLAALVADRLLDRLQPRPSATTEQRSVTLLPGALTEPELVVPDVNALAVAEFIDGLASTLCVVVGASIIRPPVLDVLVRSSAINLHAGRAPQYRGTHGGVWAVLRQAPEDVVTTIHLLDAGIDTGMPLAYVPVSIRPTMTAMAAEHRDAALRWLSIAAESGSVTLERVDPAPRGELLFPPLWAEWRRFRASASAER